MYIIDQLTKELLEPLVIGGCILGGGGGGSMAKGRKAGELAFELGSPTFIHLQDLDPKDTVITVSGVGAPAAKNQYVQFIDYVKAVEIICDVLPQKPVALMTNENGGKASVNGLLQSAVTGIPLVDAACNGRAHPTGIMGSMKLTELPSYEAVQVAVGGKPQTDSRVEMVVRGTIQSCSSLVRQAAVQAGGVVAVARNPVSAQYVLEHGAIGAISHAVEVGLANLEGTTPMDKVENVTKVLGGTILAEGKVNHFKLETMNGFDVGGFVIQTSTGDMELTFWNEYMTVDLQQKRISTFPDLIMTFSASSGLPVTSAELGEGDEIIVITAPYSKIRLGGGMFVESYYSSIEKALNKEIISYIQPLFEYQN